MKKLKWYKSKLGYILFGVIGIMMSNGVINWIINDARTFQNVNIFLKISFLPMYIISGLLGLGFNGGGIEKIGEFLGIFESLGIVLFFAIPLIFWYLAGFLMQKYLFKKNKWLN